MTRWPAALVALSLSACVAYKEVTPPEVEERTPRADPIYLLGFGYESRLAAELEAAGFLPVLVAYREQIPADAPWIERLSTGQDDADFCAPPWPVNVPGFLTLGIVPIFGCQTFGTRFDLHRTRDAPAKTIDTRWPVSVAMGWLLAPVGLLPGYHARPFEVHHRYAGAYPERALRVVIQDALAGAP